MNDTAMQLLEARNQIAIDQMMVAEPILVDVLPAMDVVPGMTSNTILTSGAPLDWEEYEGGQREAIIGGALFEGLGKDRLDAIQRLDSGEIQVGACHDFGCVGSLAGIYTASMPVFVVEDQATGQRGFCNVYEGDTNRRLNYGLYDDEVRDQLLFINDVLGPVLGAAVRRSGGIPLLPIMSRAVHMSDELHSRNTAGTTLFFRTIAPHLLGIANRDPAGVERVMEYFQGSDYFFLRLSMAAAKVMADRAHGVEGSTVVSAMTFSSRGFSIRVSGLGDLWFRGPHARVEARLFDGHDESEITWMGGESPITETVGLGGFAQAAAFPLQRYQGGSPQIMIDRNLAMYDICVAESERFRIPFFEYRGTPTGIDVLRVVESGITPVMDVGIPGIDGGQIGAGVIHAPMECFEQAARTWHAKFGSAA